MSRALAVVTRRVRELALGAMKIPQSDRFSFQAAGLRAVVKIFSWARGQLVVCA